MRHLKKGRIFNRTIDQRNALLKGLATSFFTHEKITTTLAKAKETRPIVEKLLTAGRTPTLAQKRLIAKRTSPKLMPKIIKLSEKLGDRKGGYTRIIKLGRRKGDAAEMALIELVK